MPKYIRTKDNLFKVVAEDWLGNEDEDIENMELDGYWVEPHSQNENYRKYNRNFIKKDKVIKQADTIEELCDEFVIKDNADLKPFRINVHKQWLDNFEESPLIPLELLCYDYAKERFEKLKKAPVQWQ